MNDSLTGPADQPTRPYRIWIFEDHQCFRELLADFLEAIPGIEIAGTEDDEELLYQAVDAGQVDLVILDLHLQGAGGFRVMERLKARAQMPDVLILSGQATTHSVGTAIRLGAIGYLQKTAPLEELYPALECVRQGQGYFSAGPARLLAESMAPDATSAAFSDLTLKEVDLLTRLAHGVSAKEIGAAFQLSPFTIYRMRTQLMRKINARNLQEIVTYALRNGLMDPALVR
ncbi:MAG: response regulator transcription factor [Verrucomicrobia bacterium]|nr:response regulator transcription factor [Verrucomicrobiota bacterium]